MEETSDKSGTGTGHGHGVFRWVWIAGAILVAYVLSVGPAARLRDAGLVTVGAIEVVYTPLVWASDSSPPINSFLTWYVRSVWKAH